MKNQRNTLRIALALFALFFGLFALVFAILPLRIFALIPGVLGVLAGVPAFMIALKNKKGKVLPLTGLVISFFALLIAGVLLLMPQRQVERDENFQQQIIESEVEVQDDLNNALEDTFEVDTTSH